MNMIRFLERVLKIGGPEIDLATGAPEYYAGEWIRGEVSIAAPNYRREIKSITVISKEFWVEYRTKGGSGLGWGANRYKQHGSVTIAHDFAFLPKMKYQFPFEIKLPDNCRESSKNSGWRLGAVIAGTGSYVLRKDFNIQVRLSKVLQEMVAAIEKDLKFLEVPRGRNFLPENSATRLVFRPPDHLQSELDYLMLDVSFTEEGGIEGNILVSIGYGDLKRLYAADSGERGASEFRIEPSRWVDSGGRIQFSSITNILSDRVRMALNNKFR